MFVVFTKKAVLGKKKEQRKKLFAITDTNQDSLFVFCP
jgi:hypothetical protein